MDEHRGHARPVVGAGAERHPVGVLRGRWGDDGPVGWIVWCDTCGDVLPGSDLPGSDGCDLDDLTARWTEVTAWVDACLDRHRREVATQAGGPDHRDQASPAPRRGRGSRIPNQSTTSPALEPETAPDGLTRS